MRNTLASFVVQEAMPKKGKRNRKVEVRVEQVGHALYISPRGYGDCGTVDGQGTPIILEIADGDLRINVHADINKEDPTDIINLENARESKRGKDTPASISKNTEKLCKARDLAADEAFEAYDFEKEGATIADHDHWETDGYDRLIKRFYFHHVDSDGAEEQGDSEPGSFIVDFKKGTAKVKDSHTNY